MLYHIEYTADDSTRPLVWDRRTRKTTAQIVKDMLRQPGAVIISVCSAPRHFAAYNPYVDDWDIFRRGNGACLYAGRSFRTLSGALNMLDRLSETEVRA